MLIIGWIVFGLIAGMIARALLPGDEKAGLAFSLLLSLAGAVGGGLIGRALFYWGGRAGSGGVIKEPAPFLELSLAVAGAVLVLAVYRFIQNKRMRV